MSEAYLAQLVEVLDLAAGFTQNSAPGGYPRRTTETDQTMAASIADVPMLVNRPVSPDEESPWHAPLSRRTLRREAAVHLERPELGPGAPPDDDGRVVYRGAAPAVGLLQGGRPPKE